MNPKKLKNSEKVIKSDIEKKFDELVDLFVGCEKESLNDQELDIFYMLKEFGKIDTQTITLIRRG